MAIQRRIGTTLLAFATLATLAFGQTEPTTPQPTRPSDDQSERYEARRISTDSFRDSEGPTVKEAILKKLHKANQAEIELAKLAQERTDNAEVRQLAQTIVQDHQALNTELEKCLNEKQAGPSATNRSNRSPLNRPEADRDVTNRERTPGAVATTRPQLTDRRNADAQETVPPQLCRIGEEACDNALKMKKEMLGNYQGQDFNMAFLGQQLVSHTMMLAELKAIQSTGPEDLKEITEKAIGKVEQHRNRAKQLAKKLEDDQRSTRG